MSRKGRCIQVQQRQDDGGWRSAASPAKVMPGDPPGSLTAKLDGQWVTLVFGWNTDTAPLLWRVNGNETDGYLWEAIADLSIGPVELQIRSGSTVRLRAVL